MCPAEDRADQCPTQHEEAARAALELRLGRALTESEWISARNRLLEFVRILREWDRQTIAPQLANVGDYAGKNLTRHQT
jgi:hypothetical protein